VCLGIWRLKQPCKPVKSVMTAGLRNLRNLCGNNNLTSHNLWNRDIRIQSFTL
jgi:hypothetical protein